jgi:hypothetical protein
MLACIVTYIAPEIGLGIYLTGKATHTYTGTLQHHHGCQ